MHDAGRCVDASETPTRRQAGTAALRGDDETRKQEIGDGEQCSRDWTAEGQHGGRHRDLGEAHQLHEATIVG